MSWSAAAKTLNLPAFLFFFYYMPSPEKINGNLFSITIRKLQLECSVDSTNKSQQRQQKKRSKISISYNKGCYLYLFRPEQQILLLHPYTVVPYCLNTFRVPPFTITFCLSGWTPVRAKSWALKTMGGSSVFSSTASYFSLPHFTLTETEKIAPCVNNCLPPKHVGKSRRTTLKCF